MRDDVNAGMCDEHCVLCLNPTTSKQASDQTATTAWPLQTVRSAAAKRASPLISFHLVSDSSQLKALGFSYDWQREVSTTDPDYYKWTQWIFLQIFKRGLAYQVGVKAP